MKTKKFIFNKLIRDKILYSMLSDPEQKPTYKTLTNTEFFLELKKKIVEEAHELRNASQDKILEELADIEELIIYILVSIKKKRRDLSELIDEKRNNVGGFEKKIFVEYNELAPNSKWINEYRKQPEKYVEVEDGADAYGHLDKKVRIDNQRHAGIVVKNKKILLIRRIYKGIEYWVFPGGHIRKGEDPFDTVVREIQEETSILVKNPQLVFEMRDFKRDNYDFYYLCEYISGKAKLGGEEKIKNSKENFYKEVWVNFSEIKTLNILPKFAQEWVCENVIS